MTIGYGDCQPLDEPVYFGQFEIEDQNQVIVEETDIRQYTESECDAIIEEYRELNTYSRDMFNEEFYVFFAGTMLDLELKFKDQDWSEA